MAYTAPTTITTGQLVTAALMNAEWVENIKYLANPAHVEAWHGANQSITNSTWSALTFTAADLVDTQSMHDTVTNPSRITIPTGWGGIYILEVAVYWGPSATGQRALGFRKNGSGAQPNLPGYIEQPSGGAGGFAQTLLSKAKLAAGDYVEAFVYQSSGGALNVLTGVGTTNTPFFSATWIGLG